MDIRIGVISDTHLKDSEWQALQTLFRENGVFHGVQYIIHAGDYTSHAVVDFLLTLDIKFYGVRGNMDDMVIQSELPDKRIVQINDDMKIGITHGWGAPSGLDKRVYDYINRPDLNVIVFGHSHKPTNKIIGSTLMFNPGSFKNSIFSPGRTVGLLTVTEEGDVTGEIINV